MAARTRYASPPPVNSLDYPRRPPPTIVVPHGDQSPPNRRLALMWPSNEERSSHFHTQNTVLRKPLSAFGGSKTDVVISPSGHTIVRTQAAYEAVYPPTGSFRKNQGVPRSGESTFGFVAPPQSNEGKLYSTRFINSHLLKEGGRAANKVEEVANSGDNKISTSTPAPSSWKKKFSFFEEDQLSPIRQSPPSPKSLTWHPSTYKDFPNQTLRQINTNDAHTRFRNTPEPYRCNTDSDGVAERQKNSHSPSSILKKNRNRKDLIDQYNAKKDIPRVSRFCWFLEWLLLLISLILLAWYVYGLCVLEPVPVITGDFVETLRHNIYGQDIVVNHLPAILSAFLHSAKRKSIVLSFHGGTGVGKSYVSRLMADHFIDPTQMKCLHTVVPSSYSSLEGKESAFEKSIRSFFRTQDGNCNVSMLIIDDVSGDTSKEIIGALTKAVVHLKASSVTKTIVVFLSNIGGSGITKRVYDDLMQGKPTDLLDITHFNEVIKKSFQAIDRFNANNEMQILDEKFSKEQRHFTDLSVVVDIFLPFLPLNRSHTELCITKEARLKGMTLTEMDLTWVADQITYIPPEWPLFSASGCKLVGEKLNLLLVRNYHRKFS